MVAMSNSKFVAKQSGVIEMDEMFFGISYKGNHKHSKHFKMPRPAFKRGTDNIGSYSTKMCVLFSAERGGKAYGRVMGNGVLSVDRLNKTMTPILEPGSLVITDANTILKSYLFDLPLEHKAVPGRSSRTFRKNKKNHTYAPRFYNIQHVNNLHMRFRRFLAPHNGVSSKYLEMYLDYFLWLDNEARAKSSSVDAVAEAITSRGTYNSEAVLCFRAAVPKVA